LGDVLRTISPSLQLNGQDVAGSSEKPMRFTDERGSKNRISTPLNGTFHHWQGRSGTRYPHYVMSIEEARAGEMTVVIFAVLQPDGDCRAIWIGRADDPAFRAARAACREIGGCRAHVHASDEPSQADHVVRDLLGQHPIIR
jgi:hypothetical protein